MSQKAFGLFERIICCCIWDITSKVCICFWSTPNKSELQKSINFSNYDLNLIKPLLIKELLGQIEFVIKRANSYLCIIAIILFASIW